MATLDIIAIVLAFAVLVFYGKNCNAVLSKAWVGHVFFAVLLLFAIVFAKERVILVDSAAQVFEMINSGDMVTFDHRYSMYISLLLPYTMLKINASLWMIVYTYSLSFIFLYYLIFLFNRYVLKDDKGILLMMMCYLLVAHTFYHTISETIQLLFMSTALYALLCYQAGKIWYKQALYYLEYIVLIAFCVYIHPISLFVLTFIFIFRIIDVKKIDVKTIVGIVAFAILYLISYKMMKSSTRESSIILTYDGIMNLLPVVFQSKFFWYFRLYFWSYYYLPTFLALIITTYYIVRRKYLKALFFVGFIMGFFVITLMTYYKPDYEFGIERAFLPLMFFVGLPLVYDVLPNVGKRYSAAFLVLVMVLTISRFHNVSKIGDFYTQRLDTVETIVDFANDADCQKLIVEQTQAERMFYPMWSQSIEAMMLSSMKYSPEGTVDLYVEEDGINREIALDDKSFYYVYWGKEQSIKWLNRQYFMIKRQPFKELVCDDGEYKAIDMVEVQCDTVYDEVFEDHGVIILILNDNELEKINEISDKAKKVLFVGGAELWAVEKKFPLDEMFYDYELWYFNERPYFGKDGYAMTPVPRKIQMQDWVLSDYVVFLGDCYAENMLRDISVDDSLSYDKTARYPYFGDIKNDIISGIAEEIRNNPALVEEIRGKASAKGITVDEMIMIDAEWIMENNTDKLF